MTGLIHYNLFRTTLNGSITNVATAITLTDSLPTSLAAGEYVYLTLVNGLLNEIIKIDNNTGAPAYTGCARGQQGSTAQAWASGTRVECRITRDSVDTKQESLDTAAPATATPVTGDYILIKDTSDSNKVKRALVSDVLGISVPSYTKISTQTASASATLDFTGISAYQEVLFIINDLILSVGTSTSGLYFRTSTNNGANYDNTATNYCYVLNTVRSNTSAQSYSSSETDRIRLITIDANMGYRLQSGNSVNGEVRLYDPSNTTTFKNVSSNLTYLAGASDSLAGFTQGSGFRLATTDVDAVRFAVDSGNMTSGYITMYGIIK